MQHLGSFWLGSQPLSGWGCQTSMCEAHARHSKGADAVQQWQKLMSELRPMSDAARMQPCFYLGGSL